MAVPELVHCDEADLEFDKALFHLARKEYAGNSNFLERDDSEEPSPRVKNETRRKQPKGRERRTNRLYLLKD